MSGVARRSRPERRGGRVFPAVDGLVVNWGGGPGGSSPSVHVAEIQRARLLAATVGAVEEYGYADATVSRITARARISRRTFYELFENREACLLAALQDALERIGREIAPSQVDGLSWRERVRGGLWAILSFFDREPALARLCVVQASRGSQRVLERRAEVFAQLASVIDEGRREARGADAPPLTAEGLVGAAHGIVYERLLKRDREPLTSLFGPLIGMIVLPYMGAAAARREQERPHPADTFTPVQGDTAGPVTAASDPLQGLPMRLTYRTACVLGAVAEHPGISNSAVAKQAGVSDQGQISKLLGRLERLGLLINTGSGHVKGAPNAWRLTLTGEQVAQSISAHNNGHTLTGAGEAVA